MPEQLDAATRALVERAETLGRETLAPLDEQVALGALALVDAFKRAQAASKAAGLFSLTQPVEFGGQGADVVKMVAVRDALASQGPYSLSAVFGPRPGVLAEVGEPLRTHYLLPMLAGDKLAGFGFTEPQDTPAFTRAERDGDAFVVTGRKSYVTGGASVDFVNVLADIGDEGRAFVVVDADAVGVRHERIFETIDGTRHAAFAFDKVKVPASHIVGTPGQGMRRALDQIGETRLSMAAQAVGHCRFVVNWVSQHVKARESRKEVDDATRLRLGELRVRVFGARSALYRAARLACGNKRAVNEAIAAKVLATETLWKVLDDGIQIAGGEALMNTHPLARLMGEARTLRVAEGLTDVLLQNTARGVLELDSGVL